MTMHLVDQSLPGSYRYACSDCGAVVVVHSIGMDIMHLCVLPPVEIDLEEIIAPPPKRRRKGAA